MAFATPARHRAPARRRVPMRAASGVAVSALLLLAAACGRVAPRYEPATLTVDSVPAGAAIILDGRDTGLVTPSTLTGVTPERHVVSVSLPEWNADPGEVAVDLSPLEDARVDFTLYQTGLRVASEPAGARILVNGIDTGRTTPGVVAGLEPGTVRVSLALDSWLCVPGSLDVEVVEGSIAEVPAGALALRSRRTVLVEAFGNVNCATCPQAAAAIVDVSGGEGYGPGRMLFLEYSVNWPSPVDPFYLANPVENADRYLFYWVMGAPAVYVDGQSQGSPLAAAATAAAVAGRWANDPGFLVDVVASPGAGSSVAVTVTLVPAAGVDLAGCTLQAVLYETLVDLGAAPGTNGQVEFHHVFRDRVDAPVALGTLAAGVPATFDLGLSRGPAAMADVVVIAFVQRQSDRAVLQAGSTLVPAVPGDTFGGSGR